MLISIGQKKSDFRLRDKLSVSAQSWSGNYDPLTIEAPRTSPQEPDNKRIDKAFDFFTANKNLSDVHGLSELVTTIIELFKLNLHELNILKTRIRKVLSLERIELDILR